jgi:Uncharacterized conserved protein
MEPVISEMKKGVRYWWVLLLVGLLFVAVGIYTLFNPLNSFLALSVLFGCIIFIAGVLRVIFAVSNRRTLYRWGWTLAIGLLDTVLGLILLFYPKLSMLVSAFIVGFYLLLSGAALLTYSMDVRRSEAKGWGWLTFAGIVVAILGLSVIFNPLIGAIALVGWTGIAFLMAGAFYIVFSYQIKTLKKRLDDV